MLALPAEVTMANARQVQQDLLARCYPGATFSNGFLHDQPGHQLIA